MALNPSEEGSSASTGNEYSVASLLKEFAQQQAILLAAQRHIAHDLARSSQEGLAPDLETYLALTSGVAALLGQEIAIEELLAQQPQLENMSLEAVFEKLPENHPTRVLLTALTLITNAFKTMELQARDEQEEPLLMRGLSSLQQILGTGRTVAQIPEVITGDEKTTQPARSKRKKEIGSTHTLSELPSWCHEALIQAARTNPEQVVSRKVIKSLLLPTPADPDSDGLLSNIVLKLKVEPKRVNKAGGGKIIGFGIEAATAILQEVIDRRGLRLRLLPPEQSQHLGEGPKMMLERLFRLRESSLITYDEFLTQWGTLIRGIDPLVGKPITASDFTNEDAKKLVNWLDLTEVEASLVNRVFGFGELEAQNAFGYFNPVDVARDLEVNELDVSAVIDQVLLKIVVWLNLQ